MFHLACTRFTTSTYQENREYRRKHNEAVIYGISIPIRDIYPLGCLLFVVEMNNTTNCIEGIGFIRNRRLYDKRYVIYNNPEYNRYIYRGTYWLSRGQISEYSPEILGIFETILFKGKTHLKRRFGINVLTDYLFLRWNFCYETTKQTIRLLFRHYFKPLEPPPLVLPSEEEEEEEEEEQKVFAKVEGETETETEKEKVFEEEEKQVEITYIILQKRKRKNKDRDRDRDKDKDKDKDKVLKTKKTI
jgi:hypothetical protein